MATQVDFYVLEQTGVESRWGFCARLLNKVIGQRQRATVLVDNESTARELDDFLWASPPESFLPHLIALPEQATTDQIAIAFGNVAPADRVCINLSADVPDNHANLDRLIEVVSQDPDVLSTTREKYRFYRQLGYPLQSHPIKAGA